MLRIRPDTQLRRLELGLLDNERVRIRPNSQFLSLELDLPSLRGVNSQFPSSELGLLDNE